MARGLKQLYEPFYPHKFTASTFDGRTSHRSELFEPLYDEDTMDQSTGPPYEVLRFQYGTNRVTYWVLTPDGAFKVCQELADAMLMCTGRSAADIKARPTHARIKQWYRRLAETNRHLDPDSAATLSWSSHDRATVSA